MHPERKKIMFKTTDFNKQFYKVSEVAQILGLSDKTVREYDKQGILKADRTEGNQRRFSKNEIIRFLNEKNLISDNERKDAVYARALSMNDLNEQTLFLIKNAPELTNPIILQDIGSGLDDTRPNFLKLLDNVSKNKIRKVYILDRDKLTRFGFSQLEIFFQAHGTEIVSLGKNNFFADELFEDMLSIMDDFTELFLGCENFPDIDDLDNILDSHFDKLKKSLKNI
jgi:putative resolvase